MNKNIIIWLAVGILAVVGVIAISYPGRNSGKKEQAAVLGLITDLVAPETNYDFGTISMAAGEVTHDFEIRNDSSSTLKLNKLYTSCMCTGAYFVSGTDDIGPFGMPGMGFVPSLDKELKPGESARIKVVFDPAAHGPAGVGLADRVVYLEFPSGVKQFGIKAMVTP